MENYWGSIVRLKALIAGLILFAVGVCAFSLPVARFMPLKMRRIHTTRRRFNFVPRLAALKTWWELRKTKHVAPRSYDLYGQIAMLSGPTHMSDEDFQYVLRALDELEKSEPISAFLIEARLIVSIVQRDESQTDQWLQKADALYPELHLGEYYRAKIAFLEGDRDEAVLKLSSIVESTDKFDPEISDTLQRLENQIYQLRGWDPFTLMTSEGPKAAERRGNAWYR